MTNKRNNRIKISLTDFAVGTIGFIVLLTLYYGWGQPLLQWANQYTVINRILSPLDTPSFVLSFMCLAAVIIGLEFWYFFIRNGRLSVPSAVIALFLAVVLCDNRFFADTWTFRPLCKGSAITYFDILGILIITPIIFTFVRYLDRLRSRMQKDKKCSFSDMPIENDDEDCLDRLSFADGVAKQLLELNAEVCPVSIAIVAPWGSGKTSFINLLKIRWKKEAHPHCVVDFSPWHYSDGVNITIAFFEQLIAVVNPINARLSTILKRYLRVLTEIDIDSLYHLNKFIASPNNDLKSLYSEVYDELKDSQKTFIIVIDDIDRLEAKEILEVFKIIRGSADFPHLKFVCAFDKNYVLETIKSYSLGITDRYLEKFFELEYWLPSYDDQKIIEVLNNRCKAFLDEDDQAKFSEYLAPHNKRIFGRSMSPTENGITNLRIANRWLKAIEISYKELKKEVLINDLADLELLKIVSPSIFELLRSKWQEFTVDDRGKLSLWEDKEDSQNRENDYIQSLFGQEKLNLFQTEVFINLTEGQKENIKKIMSRLLPEYGAGKSLSFSNIAYTSRYFYQHLQDCEISISEFSALMELDYESFKKELSNPAYDNKFRWLSIHLNNHHPNTIEDALLYIKKIFLIAQKNSNILVVDPFDFYRKLSAFPKDTERIKECLSDSITEHRGSKATLLFLEATKRLCPENIYSMYFEPDFPVHEAYRIMKFAIEDNCPFADVSRCFWSTSKYSCVRQDGRQVETVVYNDNAVHLYREYWENNIEYLHEELVETLNPTEQEKHYVISSIAFDLWGKDLEGLKALLNKYPADSKLSITLDFINKSLANGNKGISFEFKRK